MAVNPALMRVLPVNLGMGHTMCRHEGREVFPPFEFGPAVRLDNLRAECSTAEYDTAGGDVVPVVLIIDGPHRRPYRRPWPTTRRAVR